MLGVHDDIWPVSFMDYDLGYFDVDPRVRHEVVTYVAGTFCLPGESIGVFGNYRPDLTIGLPWILGQARFLGITVLKDDRRINGTVFVAPDGTVFRDAGSDSQGSRLADRGWSS
ncbi:MAG TPA: hypothetical protein VK513_07965 [Terriglobales bacterium]|nr:hypothetical protein [Terriglobales bacterium]